MNNWEVLQSEGQLQNELSVISHECQGKCVTNILAFDGTIDLEIGYTDYLFRRINENVSLLKREDGFYKLLFAWGYTDAIKIDDFPENVQKSAVVCDIAEVNGKERQENAVNKLKEMGFVEYKRCHRWVCNAKDISVPEINRFRIRDNSCPDELKEIFNVFDKYADMLPMRNYFAEYMRTRLSFSIYINDRHAGSIIYRVNGAAAHCDLVFAVQGCQGAGGFLTMEFMRRCKEQHQVKRIYAWINDDNDNSIRMFKRLGFIETSQYKMTFLRKKTSSSLA